MGLFAYIDPGSGSLLLQALIAGLLSIPFFFRRTIGGAWQRLRGGPGSHEPSAGSAAPPATSADADAADGGRPDR